MMRLARRLTLIVCTELKPRVPLEAGVSVECTLDAMREPSLLNVEIHHMESITPAFNPVVHLWSEVHVACTECIMIVPACAAHATSNHQSRHLSGCCDICIFCKCHCLQSVERYQLLDWML